MSKDLHTQNPLCPAGTLSSSTPDIPRPRPSRPCKGPLFRKLQASSWSTPSLGPTRGSHSSLAPSLRVLSSTATQKGGQHSGCPGPSVQEGCTHLWAFGVTHPKESTPPHRTQERQMSFHYRDSAPNLKAEGPSPVCSQRLFPTSPSCPSHSCCASSCLEGTRTSHMDSCLCTSPGQPGHASRQLPSDRHGPPGLRTPGTCTYLSPNTSSLVLASPQRC